MSVSFARIRPSQLGSPAVAGQRAPVAPRTLRMLPPSARAPGIVRPLASRAMAGCPCSAFRPSRGGVEMGPMAAAGTGAGRTGITLGTRSFSLWSSPPSSSSTSQHSPSPQTSTSDTAQWGEQGRAFSSSPPVDNHAAASIPPAADTPLSSETPSSASSPQNSDSLPPAAGSEVWSGAGTGAGAGAEAGAGLGSSTTASTDPTGGISAQLQAVGGTSSLDAAPSLASEFTAAGLPNGWFTVPMMQETLDWVMINTGLPWWGVIMSAVVVAKTLLLPLIIRSQRAAARMNEVQPQVTALMNEMKAAQKSGNKARIDKNSEDVRVLMQSSQVNPLAPLVPMLFTAPTFITLFFAVDKMCHAGLHSLTTGGTLWFGNLTAPDPYMVLPIFTATNQLISMELGPQMPTTPGQNPAQARALKFIMRVGLLLSPILLRNFPSGVLLMWATNAVYTTAQNLILQRPAVKAYLGIGPRARPEPESVPDAVQDLKQRLAQEKKRKPLTSSAVQKAAPPRPVPRSRSAVSTAGSNQSKPPGRRASPPPKVAGAPKKA